MLLPEKRKKGRYFVERYKIPSHLQTSKRLAMIGFRSTLSGDAAIHVRALTVVSLVISLRNLSKKIGKHMCNSSDKMSPKCARICPIDAIALSLTS